MKADGIAPDVDPVGWWKNNADELPFWSAAAKLALLLQSSSGFILEGLFHSDTRFGHLQDLVLQDYIECSLMLQYNKR